ncbi:MAG TPA: DUF805 domain-containing protein [Allosphingosinicella sp.]|nr:DUF805 domain-containing protein [Allosphingosinicella sp.]
MISIVFEENGFPCELTSEREFARAIASGRLKPDTLVRVLRSDGSSSWKIASGVAELRPHFGLEAEQTEPQSTLTDLIVVEAQAVLRGDELDAGGDGLEPQPVSAPMTSTARDARRQDAGKASPAMDRNILGDAQPDVILQMALLPLKRYADFSGRSRRREFWSFSLVLTVWLCTVFVLVLANSSLAGTLLVASALGLSVPSLAVWVRRLHDQNISGWIILLAVIPWIGALILLILACLDGTRGPNKFGPDPKGPS